MKNLRSTITHNHFVAVMITGLIVGCTVVPLSLVDEKAVNEQLQILRYDETTPDDLFVQFGQPQHGYENGRILVYEMCVSVKGLLLSLSHQEALCRRPNVADYNLVLVFGADHVLEKYNLLQVR
jgi:hypothetical protein